MKYSDAGVNIELGDDVSKSQGVYSKGKKLIF